MNKEEVIERVLDRIKDTYTISGNVQDKHIKTLISDAYDEFCMMTGVEGVREPYIRVIDGVVKKRYNRRTSDGLTSLNVDGYSVSYDDKGDFEEYINLIALEYPKVKRLYSGAVMFW